LLDLLWEAVAGEPISGTSRGASQHSFYRRPAL